MRCSISDLDLYRIVDGETGLEEPLAAHLESCDTCRRRVAAAERFDATLRRGLRPAADPWFVARFRQRLAERGRRDQGFWRLLALRLLPVTGAVAALALAAVMADERGSLEPLELPLDAQIVELSAPIVGVADPESVDVLVALRSDAGGPRGGSHGARQILREDPR